MPVNRQNLALRRTATAVRLQQFDGNLQLKEITSLFLLTYTMATMHLFRKFAVFALILAFVSTTVFAQRSAREPKQEKLLNGLRVLMFQDATRQDVELKLRVHSGSAFDPQKKEGVMKMLAEMIFPSEVARDYFREDLGGGFKIESNYDYIQITASSKPDTYLKLLETIAGAVANPTIDKETTDAVRSAVLSEVNRSLNDPAYVADGAASERLLGTFPYGRPENGTPESLAKIDFADIKFAYDRFFGADNSTITISGNFDPNNTYRAVRRYFGAWLKSDRRVPPTFRQPDDPPAAIYTVASPEEGRSEIRFAVRGFARSDADAAAAAVLARIYNERLRAKAPADKRESVKAVHHPHVLPGVFLFGFSDIRSDSVPANGEKIEATDILMQVLNEKVNDAEFRSARDAVQASYAATDTATLWLDADTFRIGSVKADQSAFQNVTIADVQRVADKIKTAPMATVLVVSPRKEEIK